MLITCAALGLTIGFGMSTDQSTAYGRQSICDGIIFSTIPIERRTANTDDLERAKAILAHWPHALPTSTEEFRENEASRDTLIIKLREIDDLLNVLMTLVLSPNDDMMFPGAVLPSLAADAYLRAHLPDDTLQSLLLSRNAPFLSRESVATALAARDLPLFAVSVARKRLVCVLSSNVRVLSPEEARLLANMLWHLNAESNYGSVEAKMFVNAPSVASAAEWLETRGYRVRPSERR